MFIKFPTSSTPIILSLYRPQPQTGSPPTYTLIANWRPSISTTNEAVTINLPRDQWCLCQPGDTFGHTWLNTGTIYLTEANEYNYYSIGTSFTTLGQTVSPFSLFGGNRQYSIQAILNSESRFYVNNQWKTFICNNYSTLVSRP